MINLSLTILTFKERYRIQSDIMNEEKFALRKVRKLRKFSLFSKFSCNFFIMSEAWSMQDTILYPLATPAHNGALRDALRLSFSQ